MDRSVGFPPVAGPDARILVLGSLPGRQSIAAEQYYAHPRNAFWRIMRDIHGIRGDYEDRCRGLVAQQIALWDVLHASIRPGSLDADIDLKSALPNDFAAFIRKYDKLQLVVFNGKKAGSLFRRLVDSSLCCGLETEVLPSTSPAYAAMAYERKLDVWRTTLLRRR